MAETNRCVYPQSFATAMALGDTLDGIIANQEAAASLYLDTKEEHSNPLYTEGEDHHQGLARTHWLHDGSIYFFLTHSEMDEDDQGQLMQFRYDGATDGAHVVPTDPLTVAEMTDQHYLDERHPCDLCFLPDVEHQDAGYLFLAESHDRHRVSVWRWEPGAPLASLGEIFQGFPSDSPNWVFVDLVDGTYYLGIAGDGVGRLFTADPGRLFPGCKPGVIDLAAFQPTSPESVFIVPSLDGASQAKLIRDGTGQWFLLGFRSDAPDDPQGTDYVDAYRVRFTPTFAISPRVLSRHVSFPPGNTGFASTGAHYVDETGRLLLLSSSRWSDDVGPGDASYVSRVDELASAQAARWQGCRAAGYVVGVDMTAEMLDKSRQTAALLTLDHVEFRDGLAEALPADDGWANVVISNGMINLCADKQAVFAEIHRVLRPGGRLQFADIANGRPVPIGAIWDIDLWTG